jgi:uncharacterized membrane protein
MIASSLVAAMAILHIHILSLVMFLWEGARAGRAFGTTA